jgi:7-cyano-7-deazaguanine reductase
MAQAEGLTIPFEGPEKINTGIMETFPYRPKELGVQDLPEQTVTYETKEFSAVCPFSGLPDIGTVIVEYVPNQTVLELKSFKYYLLSYRNVGIYQEHATQTIYSDLQKTLQPKKLKVTTIYNTRGGIDTTCTIQG